MIELFYSIVIQEKICSCSCKHECVKYTNFITDNVITVCAQNIIMLIDLLVNLYNYVLLIFCLLMLKLIYESNNDMGELPNQ